MKVTLLPTDQSTEYSAVDVFRVLPSSQYNIQPTSEEPEPFALIDKGFLSFMDRYMGQVTLGYYIVSSVDSRHPSLSYFERNESRTAMRHHFWSLREQVQVFLPNGRSTLLCDRVVLERDMRPDDMLSLGNISKTTIPISLSPNGIVESRTSKTLSIKYFFRVGVRPSKSSVSPVATGWRQVKVCKEQINPQQHDIQVRRPLPLRTLVPALPVRPSSPTSVITDALDPMFLRRQRQRPIYTQEEIRRDFFQRTSAE